MTEMIFIPLGLLFRTDYVTENRGKVAEFCRVCQQARVFDIIRTYIDRTEFLLLHKTEEVGICVTCRKCGQALQFRRRRYARILDPEEEISLRDLLKESNPRLAERLAQQEIDAVPLDPDAVTNLEKTSAIQGTLSDSSAEQDPALAALMEYIAEYDDPRQTYGGAYERLCARLFQWRTLNAADQAELANKVERFVALRRSEAFLTEIASTFPRRPGVAPAVLIWAIGLLVVGLGILFLGSQIRIEPEENKITFFALCMAAPPIAIAWIAWHTLSSWAMQRWLKKILVPRARDAGIDLRTLAKIFGQSLFLSEAADPGLALLRHNRDLLRSGLIAVIEGQKE